jgi:hypothetical protein
VIARSALILLWLTSIVAVALGQSPLQKAAAVLSEERPTETLGLMSKQVAIKVFTPLLKAPSDSSGYVVAAFALAMKGVDTDTNLARMMVPIKSHKDEKLEELVASHGMAENQIMLADIPNGIYLVYKTRKYAPALKALFTMPVEWPAAEYRDDCVMAQLRKDPKPVLAMAANDPKIYATLWDIVDWNVGSINDRKIFIHRMQTAKWTTTPMKKAALQLAKDLKRRKNRPLDG